MTHCASERETGLGLGWAASDPFTVRFETPRLLIRAWEAADAPALFDAVRQSRERLLPWVDWARDGHRTAGESLAYITGQAAALRDPATFLGVGVGIFDRETDRVLGGTGIHDVRRDTASAETGYWVRADAWGRGIATEATRHVLSWCFRPQADGGLGLRRVRIYCSSANAASRRVIEKLGIRHEVHQRADYFVRDVGVTDRLGWGVLDDEWDTAGHRPR